jgi:hypothetical protein
LEEKPKDRLSNWVRIVISRSSTLSLTITHRYTTILAQQNQILTTGLQAAYQKLVKCCKLGTPEDATVHEILETLGITDAMNESAIESPPHLLSSPDLDRNDIVFYQQASSPGNDEYLSRMGEAKAKSNLIIGADYEAWQCERSDNGYSDNGGSMTWDIGDFSDPELQFTMDNFGSGVGASAFYQWDSLEWPFPMS